MLAGHIQAMRRAGLDPETPRTERKLLFTLPHDLGGGQQLGAKTEVPCDDPFVAAIIRECLRGRTMSTISIEDAQARLPDLIEKMQPGEELLITRDQKPVARLISEKATARLPRTPGTLRGTVVYMAPDFNAPLDEFREYMP
jgi:antitoxin (DNA-binding transcriptional repressor) of toxin-antitoxin stability system